MSGSKSLGVLAHKLTSPDGNPRNYYDTLQSEHSTDMDLVSEMSKSLDSLLRTGAGSDIYMSCDDESDRRWAGDTTEGYTSVMDSTTDIGTTTDHGSVSSAVRFTSSTSVDDSDIPGAEVYAETLAPTPQSAGYIHRRNEPLTTDTDSDYLGSCITPTPYLGESEGGLMSDTDTEIALLSDNAKDGLGGGNIPIGYSSTDIDLSETEVTFIDPHANIDVAMAASEVAKGLGLVTDSIHDDHIPPRQDSSSSGEERLGPEPRPESGRIVIRKPVPDSPEGQPQHSTKVKVMAPSRQVAKGPAPPPPVKQDSGIASGDSLGEMEKEGEGSPARKPSRFPEGLITSYGDGYLADRSSSASPTFTESKGKLVKRHARVAGETTAIAVATEMTEDPVTMEPVKEVAEPPVRSPVQEVRSPVKHVRSPVKEVRSPIKEVRSPVNEVRSPVNEVRSPVGEEKRGSTDSGLIFEMDDIQPDGVRKAESQDRLNMSCDSDDIFRDDTPSNDLPRYESKMATSSSPDISTTGISMATSDDQLDMISDVRMATPPSPPAISDRDSDVVRSSSSEFTVRSGSSKERKNTPQRKKSVKELLTKFETANSPPGEESRPRPVYQRPRVVKVKTSPTEPESDTQFGDIDQEAESRMSTSAPTGKHVSPSVEVKDIVIETKCDVMETVPKPTLSATSPNLSTSPKVTDRIKCFETSSSVGDSTDSEYGKVSPAPRESFRSHYSPSPSPALPKQDKLEPTTTTPSLPKPTEPPKQDSTSESEPEVRRPAMSRPGRASRNRAKDIENMPTMSLAERMKCFQESSSTGSGWGRSSSERESLSPLHITESDSSTTVESRPSPVPSDKSPLVENKPITVDERKDSVKLSDRRKMFESSKKDKSLSVDQGSVSSDTSLPRAAKPDTVEDTTTPPRGTFQRKVAKSEPPPTVAPPVDSDSSSGDKFGSLSERRKRFESFKREELEKAEGKVNVKSNNNQKNADKQSKHPEPIVDNSLSQRAKLYGAKTVVLEGGNQGSKSSDQSDKVVDNAAACQAVSANKENIENNNERPMSVRDLSRQFERQQASPGDTTSQGQLQGHSPGGHRGPTTSRSPKPWSSIL